MSDASDAISAGPRPHRPWLAALLSFAFPGLGHAYAGRYRTALLLALPVAALVILVAGVATGVLTELRNALFASDVLFGVIVANGILLAWRGIAIADAGLTPWRRIHGHDRRTALMVVIGLLVVTLAMHVWVGAVVVQLDDTLEQVFAPDELGGPDPGQGGSEEPPEETGSRWDGTERINVLLLGTDAAPGRDAALTDVILVVSADPVTRSAELISIPRDTALVPLPDETVYAGGLYPDRINSVMARAAADPATWCPDLVDEPEACGLRTIERAVGLYLGIEIHHYAIVDMAGFADMIDAIGGVDLCLPGRLVDPEFDGTISDRYDDGLVLPAGCHAYDGLDALAYARSRKGWIEMPDGTIDGQSDFDRSERQQRVLLAMRYELTQADTIFELPGLLRAIARTVSTDVPREQAGDLASLLPLISGPDIDRVVLGYPEFVELPLDAEANYRLLPRRDAIRAAMAEVFGADELLGWYLGSRADGPGTEPQAEGSAPPEP